MKIKILCFLILLQITPKIGVPGDFSNAIGGRSTALGGQTAAIIDVFSAGNNQAGMGFIKDYSIGIYAENKYILQALNYVNGSVVLPTKTGVFGLNVNYFGQQQYNEKKVGISFAKSFADKFSVGIQFDYLNISISEYGNKNMFTFEVGGQYFVFSKLLIGAHIFNPLRIEIESEQNEKLATIMNFGAQYMPSEKISILFELEKDIDYSPLFKMGLEYNVIEKLALRGGFNANPYSGSFGIGVLLKTINIDMAASVHPVLGITPHFSLTYAIPRKNK